MTELQWLLALVVALYLSEGATWIRRDVVGFRQPWPGRWRVTFPGALFGNAQAGLVVGGPWPGLKGLILCPGDGCSLSPDGALAYSAQALAGHERPRHSERFLAWEEVRQVEWEAERVYVAGQLVLEAAHSVQASRVAALLSRLAGLEPAAREAAIVAHLAAAWDGGAIRERAAQVRQNTRGLAWSGSLLTLLVVGGVSACWVWPGMRFAWPVVLLAGLLIHALTVVLYRRAERQLVGAWPASGAPLWVWVACSPLAAMRGADLLARYRWAEFQPLAVGEWLLPRGDFERLARQTLVDLVWPLLPACPEEPLEARATEAWYRARVQEEAVKFVRQAGLDPAALLGPPVRESAQAQTYCPRCRGQFVARNGACGPCGGWLLVPWPADEGERASA